MSQAIASTPIGTCLQERYVLEQVLGRGGMGAVYLARDQRLNKRVAVKELTAQTSDDESRRKIEDQFHHEAHLLASLQNPGLVSISDYFSQRGSQYLVMEYVHGVTLDTLLGHSRGYPDPLHVLDWADQLCRVLTYLHHQAPPIIFRDLKPSNIMLDSEGRIKLIDFGIARIFDPNHRTTTIIRGAGTPGFAPLEQYGEGTDVRSDVYSLGATLYSLLTRTLPPTAIRLVSGEDALVPPSHINPGVSAELENTLLRMMALRREDRYQTMADVQVALRAVRSSHLEDKTAAPAVPHRCSSCGTALPAGSNGCIHCASTSPQLAAPGQALVLGHRPPTPSAPPARAAASPLAVSKEVKRTSDALPAVPAPPVRSSDDKVDVHIFVHTDKDRTDIRTGDAMHTPDTTRVPLDGSHVTRRVSLRRNTTLDLVAAVVLGVLLTTVLALWNSRPLQPPPPTVQVQAPPLAASVASTPEGLCKISHLQVLSARLMGDSGVLYTLQDSKRQHYHLASSKSLRLTVGEHIDTVWARVSKEGGEAYLSDVEFP